MNNVINQWKLDWRRNQIIDCGAVKCKLVPLQVLYIYRELSVQILPSMIRGHFPETFSFIDYLTEQYVIVLYFGPIQGTTLLLSLRNKTWWLEKLLLIIC